MIFIKKMCILRQLRQGFSEDGKTLTGLIKTEQYGKNLSVEVSVINFAPLTTGEYYCLLADPVGRTELLPLCGKSIFNILTELNTSEGFCGVICLLKNGITPVAYGVNGKKIYDWKSLLNGLFKDKKNFNADMGASFSKNEQPESQKENFDDAPVPRDMAEHFSEMPSPYIKPVGTPYDDTRLATENYFAADYETKQKEISDGGQKNERVMQEKAYSDANYQGGDTAAEAQKRQDTQKNADDRDICRAAETPRDAAGERAENVAKDPDGYYFAVKSEIDALFQKYPADDTLKNAFPHSEWVRIRGKAQSAEYLIGVIYNELKARYICYAIRADDPAPPEEIKEVCVFVPVTKFDPRSGFFVIFQSAATGECIRPESV